MRSRWNTPLVALLAAAIAAGASCSKSSVAKVETKATTKSTNPDGTSATTKTDSRQYGSTLVSKTETVENTGKRTEKSQQETVIGTVTAYAAGKHIVVLTGDGSKHDFDLADKKTTATVDRRITVGTKVELNLARDDEGRRSIRVVPAA